MRRCDRPRRAARECIGWRGGGRNADADAVGWREVHHHSSGAELTLKVDNVVRRGQPDDDSRRLGAAGDIRQVRPALGAPASARTPGARH